MGSFGYDPKLYAEQKRTLVSEITADNRITKSRELLLTDGIDVGDFREIKAECEGRIVRLEAQLNEITEKGLGSGSIDELTRIASSNIQNRECLYCESGIQGNA